MSYTVGSLFAGIGGFDLGFERAGFKTIWQVEINPYCQKVLAKNFPEAKRYGDIRECGRGNLVPVDVICGGFPCQDISNAGLRAGIDGERSGLWGEMHRIIGELRPRFALVENVAALLGRGIGRVLGDLAEIGYDAEWEVISAADVGAPHLRERVWILAYPNSAGRQEQCRPLAIRAEQLSAERLRSLRNASRERLPYWAGGEMGQPSPLTEFERPGGREIERDFRGVAYGVYKRVDRLRGLGNAVVPQIPQMIAHRIRRELEAR